MGKAGLKVSYKDTWTWGDVQAEWTEAIKEDHPNLYAVIQAANAAAGEDMGAFLCWLGVRVLELHRILKPTGSLYLHIDHTAHAYAKAMMDAIFGRANFRNEIVWCYSGPANTTRWFPRKHDVILFYGKSDAAPFHRQYAPHKSGLHNDGTVFGMTDGDAAGVRSRESTGKLMEDWWTDIGSGAHISKHERTGYPTQKPLALYERIIKASSNEGDLVLDPFAGCATTCIAAERLGRDWIAIDINKDAEKVVRQRLEAEAQLPFGSRSWSRAVHIRTGLPRRTDDGTKAAPELVLVSPTPRGPRMTIRELRRRLSEDDGPTCQGCGYRPPQDLVEYLEVDHRQPKSRQGRDDIRNRVLLCSPCNGVKGNKLTLAELRLKRIEEGRMLNRAWNRAWYEREGKFG